MPCARCTNRSRQRIFSILRSTATSSERSARPNPPPVADATGPTPSTTRSMSASFSARPVAPDPKTSRRADGNARTIAARILAHTDSRRRKSASSEPAFAANEATCACNTARASASSSVSVSASVSASVAPPESSDAPPPSSSSTTHGPSSANSDSESIPARGFDRAAAAGENLVVVAFGSKAAASSASSSESNTITGGVDFVFVVVVVFAARASASFVAASSSSRTRLTHPSPSSFHPPSPSASSSITSCASSGSEEAAAAPASARAAGRIASSSSSSSRFTGDFAAPSGVSPSARGTISSRTMDPSPTPRSESGPSTGLVASSSERGYHRRIFEGWRRPPVFLLTASRSRASVQLEATSTGMSSSFHRTITVYVSAAGASSARRNRSSRPMWRMPSPTRRLMALRTRTYQSHTFSTGSSARCFRSHAPISSALQCFSTSGADASRSSAGTEPAAAFDRADPRGAAGASAVPKSITRAASDDP